MRQCGFTRKRGRHRKSGGKPQEPAPLFPKTPHYPLLPGFHAPEKRGRTSMCAIKMKRSSHLRRHEEPSFLLDPGVRKTTPDQRETPNASCWTALPPRQERRSPSSLQPSVATDGRPFMAATNPVPHAPSDGRNSPKSEDIADILPHDARETPVQRQLPDKQSAKNPSTGLAICRLR